MAEIINKNIRKTLVIGLGGSGSRIALELKARMEARDGGKNNYGRAVKFLFIDTAKENFTAQQPDHPSRPPVCMDNDEFISISDVPLDDLIDSQKNNPGMKAILPDTLYTSQIDQGAQQIRRLGRVALFYHYAHTVKGRLSNAINDLYSMRNLDSNGTERRVEKQLRVYIIGSICGGTGGGTFIDIAYLVRNLVREIGKARSERSVTTIGVLLLPEAFPDIVTTGYQRIRANAYGALLDLEYFSQLTDASTPLYDVEIPEEGRVAVSGAPFTWCYLVGSGPHSLHGRVDLEPILAEALYLQVTSRLGEQLDATLDNIRPYLSLDYQGYRTFYSALGFSQIIYPERWLRERFTSKLQHELLEQLLEGRTFTPESDPIGLFRNAASDVLKPDKENLLRPLRAELSRAKQAFSRNEDPIDYVESVFENVRTEYEKREETVKERAQSALRAAEEALQAAFEAHLNNPDEGLRWTRSWIKALQSELKDETQRLRTIEQATPDSDQERERLRKRLRDAQDRALPLAVQLQKEGLVHKAIEDIKSWIGLHFEQKTVAKHLIDIYASLANKLTEYDGHMSNAINFWEHTQAEIQDKSDDKPIYPPSTTVSLSEEEVNEKAGDLVKKAVEDTSGMLSTLIERLGGLTASLPIDRQDDALKKKFEDFCVERYPSQTSDINNSEKIKNAKLEERGAPLLTLLDGKTLGMSPRVIRVIGTNTSQKGEGIKTTLNNQDDVSVVATGDPTAVTYLHTIHGIPAIALANFEKYRGYYLEMIQQNRAAIFHLDEALEHSPHDPGSIEFFDSQTLVMFFARALAYGWIVRIDAPVINDRTSLGEQVSLFAFSKSFYDTLDKNLMRRRTKVDNQRSEAQEDQDEIRLQQLQEEIDTLEGLRNALKDTVHAKGDDTPEDLYPHPLPRAVNPVRYAVTLAEALAALSSQRELALAFRDAFNESMATLKSIDEAAALKKFSKPQESDQNKFSQGALDKGRSEELEKRLQRLAGEYNRLRAVKVRNADSARLPLAYYIDDETNDENKRGDA